MKRIFIIVACALCSFSNIWAADSVKDLIGTYEHNNAVDEADIYENIFGEEIANALVKTCDGASMGEAAYREGRIRTIFENQFAVNEDVLTLEESKQRYDKLARFHETADGYYSEDLYCAIKHVLYDVQDYLRDQHIAALKRNDLMHDFDGFSSSLYGYYLKEDLLDLIIERNRRYVVKLGKKLDFDVVNTNFRSTLSENRRSMMNKIEDIMEIMFYKALYRLTSEGVFSDEDVEMFDDKIEFELVESCDIFHGKYSVKETMTSEGDHIKFDLDSLRVKVNFCTNYFVLREIDMVFEKVIMHEMGHHFYYFHDEQREDFEDLCRSSRKKQNGKCRSADFASDYSKTVAPEDYAEHFMFWFLDLFEVGDPQGPRLRRKVIHFEEAVK